VLGRKGFTAAVEAWDIAAGKRSTLFDLAGPQPDGADGGAYHALTLTPDGRRLAAADTCGPVVVHDMKTGRLIARLPVFPFSYPAVGIVPDRAYVLAFSPDGRFLAASTSIHTIDVWDVEKRTRVARFAGHDATPWHLQFDPSGNGVWSASDDGIAYRWDLSEVVRGLKK
jgi:WD40 repeat protein